MLRRALQRALQLEQAAWWAGSSGPWGAGPLPGLAAAVQRLAIEPSQSAAAAAAQLTRSRHFAAAAGGGGSSGEASPPPAPASSSSLGFFERLAAQEAGGGDGDEEEGEEQPLVLASQSGQLVFDSVGEALEKWGSAMDRGDWNTAYDIFEGLLPVDGDEFPSLDELLEWDPEGDEKESRRLREEEIKAMHAARLVRRLDPVSGRAYGVGRRKTSTALVWLRPAAQKAGGKIMVNRRPYDQYFPDLLRRNDLAAPFMATNSLCDWDVLIRVRGGGPTGQAQAARQGIARALQNWEPKLHPALKAQGLLSRDMRAVERKKPGLKKARKAFQWVKR